MANPAVVDLKTTALTSEGSHAFQAMGARLATSHSDFAAECLRIHTEAPLWERPSLEPLKRWPCVYVDDARRLIVPMSPVHVGQNALEGPLRVMRDCGESNPYQGFGHLIEDHVHHALATTFGDRYQRLKPLKKQPRAEGILWYPNGFVVVEVKSRRIADGARFQHRDDAECIEELRRRDVPKAIEQIEATIAQVLDGNIPCQCGRPPYVIGSLIVMSDEVPCSFIAGGVLHSLLPPTRKHVDHSVLRPQLVTLAEIEGLDTWSGVNLIDVLRDKMGDPDTSIESVNAFMDYRGIAIRDSAYARSLYDGLYQTHRHWVRGA